MPGSIPWIDLTVPDADSVRDFYSEVTGWQWEGADMGGYQDYCMKPPGEGKDPVAGICHARGTNADMPAQWLVYINVDDVDASAKRVVALGGKILVGPKGTSQRICVIQDPAGAIAALFQQK